MYYLVYFHSNSGDAVKHKDSLKQRFGDGNVYAPNGANVFVIKTPLSLTDIMEKLGFNEEDQFSGFVSRIEQDGVNGWFSNTLWEFLRSPVQKLVDS